MTNEEKCDIILSDGEKVYNFMLDILLKYKPEKGKSFYLKTENNNL